MATTVKKKPSKYIIAYCVAQLGRPYWRGGFGQHASFALLDFERRRFPASYTAPDFEQQARAGEKVHDCSGLPKGAMLCATVNSDPNQNLLKDYDKDPQMLWDAATVRGDDMRKFPRIPCYLVYNSGKTHVGVYIGGEDVVEARGHAYGVVKSKITDSRWKFWSDYYCCDYSDQKEDDEVKYNQLKVCRKGSTGVEVKTIQANVGVFVDGVFGKDTDLAVKTFQKKHGLAVDGIVGEKTWRAIIEGWYR